MRAESKVTGTYAVNPNFNFCTVTGTDCPPYVRYPLPMEIWEQHTFLYTPSNSYSSEGSFLPKKKGQAAAKSRTIIKARLIRQFLSILERYSSNTDHPGQLREVISVVDRVPPTPTPGVDTPVDPPTWDGVSPPVVKLSPTVKIPSVAEILLFAPSNVARLVEKPPPTPPLKPFSPTKRPSYDVVNVPE